MKQRTWRQLAAFTTLAALAAASLPATAGVPTFKEKPALKGDAEFCFSRDDGVYAHDDCRVYYSCEKGRVREATCPEGKVFDERKSPDGTPGPALCVAPETVHANCDALGYVR